MSTFNGRLEAIEYLLSRGAYVDSENDRGDTALSIASYKGNIELVNLLISVSIIN
jgi:ankyrin repeat protein